MAETAYENLGVARSVTVTAQNQFSDPLYIPGSGVLHVTGTGTMTLTLQVSVGGSWVDATTVTAAGRSRFAGDGDVWRVGCKRRTCATARRACSPWPLMPSGKSRPSW